MFKKSLALCISVVLAAATLVGCGGKTQDSIVTNQETDTTDSKNSTGNGEGDVTLTVFDAQAYGLSRYDELMKSFEDSHPGVNVEVQHAPNDFDSLLKARFNSNDIPDIFCVQTGTVANSYYEFAYDWTGEKDMLALFNEEALETGKDADGNVKSLPWTFENMGLLYNKDLFAQAGITELPKTMTELEEACKKLESAGITAFALAAKETWVLSQLSTHFMMDKSIDAKGVVEAINDGSLTYDQMPNYKNFYKFLDLAKKYGPEKPLEIDWEISESMLANGEAAIIHMGDWCQSTLDDLNPDANIGFLPCPVSENPEDTTLLSSVSWTYIVNKDSKNLELAKEYLAYILTSEDGIDWMTNAIAGVPGTAGTFEVSGYLANDAAQYISKGKTNGWIHTLMSEGYADSLGPIIQGYLLGQTDAAETLKLTQEAGVE